MITKWRRVFVWGVVAIGLAAVALAALAYFGGDRFTDDEEFSDAFASAWQADGMVRVSEFTDFEWETMTVVGNDFPEWVESEIGRPLLSEQYLYTETLLVFCAAGDVVALKPLVGELNPTSQPTYSSDAVIGFVDGEPHKQLIEPSGERVDARCA